MRRELAIVVIAITGLLAACSSAPKKGSLASLGDLKLKIDKDAPINGARDKAMASYWEFMNNAPQDNLKIAALRRLADMELEKSEESFQQKLEQINAKQETITPQDEEALKGLSYDKAIKLYQDALAAAEKAGTQVDSDVLYQLSKAYESSGKLKESLDSLDRLLAQYPALENRDEIHFRRGELLFKLGQYSEADLAYSQAMVVSPTSRYYNRSLSKRGWTAYKQHKFENALFSFFSLIDREFRNSDGSLKSKTLSRGDREFLDDTMRAIVLSFNELGGAAAVSEYFKENGRQSYEEQVYLALGDFYMNKKRYLDAKNTYQEFSLSHSDDASAPLFELKGIEAMAAGGFAKPLLEAKVAFATKYRVGGNYWAAQNEKVHQALIPLLSQNVEDIAKHYHSLAQKNNSSKDEVQAQYWYRQFLQQFPNAEHAKEINFLLAESLFEDKSYAAAAQEYEKTAYQYPAQGADVEAAYAELLAYSKQMQHARGDAKMELTIKSAHAAQRFADTFAEDKRVVAVLSKASEDLYGLKLYDRAVASANRLLQLKNLDRASQRVAWTIIAGAEFEARHYAKAEQAYKKAMTFSDDREQKEELKVNIAAAIYKQGEALRDSGSDALAATQFQRLAQEAPSSPFSKAARFDLAVSLLKQKNYEASVDALLAFRHDYPNDQLSSKVSKNLAIAYNAMGDSVAAAEEMEYLMLGETDTAKKRDMAWQIAKIYDDAKMPQQMLDSYLYYVNHFPDPVEPVVEAQSKVADVYKMRGDHERYIYWLNQIIASDRQAAGQRTDRTRYLAANATFILAEPKLEQYNAIRLRAPLKTNLSLKKKRMKEAVEAYTRAANYGIADVTTAAYYHLGEIYGNFSKELLDSERPSGLSGTALDEYDMLLEEQAFPFEEKSINLFEENIKLIREEGLYDEWVKKSFVELRKLNPVRYSKEERRDVIAHLVQ